MFREYVEKICELKDLRTIIVSDWKYDNLSLKEGELDAFFMKLRKLYVVEIEARISPDVKRVPMSLFQLRNLRYLKFWNYHEESLNLDAHSELLWYQLRFLYTNLIPNVGRLMSLQELESFDVRMERGFELKQLEHLNDLYGSLSIFDLKNVKSKEEADRAKLSDKKGLHKLHLQFESDLEYGDVLRDNDIEILDGLCPPPQIKELTIEYYSGKRLPSWILENNDNVIHLQHLRLFACDGLEALHRINELSDLLSLDISCLTSLKSWVPLPLNLTQLEICYCPSLAFAVKEDLDMIMSTKGTRISRIVTFKEMMIDYMEGDSYRNGYPFLAIDRQFNEVLERLDLICQLKDVYGKPFLPSALERLKIGDCIITDKILAESLQRLTSLTHLDLEDIITITCIPKEVLSSLTNLLDLEIYKCLLLTSIGGLDTHSTLQRLHISCCINLKTFETSSSCGRRSRSSTLKYAHLEGCMLSDDMLHGLLSPERLYVSDIPTMENPHIGHFNALIKDLNLQVCPNLVSLRGLNELTNLECLNLHICPNLVSLRGLNGLTNLERLHVSGCDKLKCYSDADKLPQLKELHIYRFSLLQQLVSRDGFSSLVSLRLYKAEQEYFSQEECDMFRHLSSLTKITFDNCKMRSLPNLMCLHSLMDLSIVSCKNLSSLSDVPPSVQHIFIFHCNSEISRSCNDRNHPNWHKISHIPSKLIH